MQSSKRSSDHNQPPTPSGPTGDVKESFLAVAVPGSELFCHPSRLANNYEPGVERVHQKGFLIPGEDVLISIRRGTTLPYARQVNLGWRGRMFSRMETMRHGPVLQLGERLVYDTRSVFNGNMAHLVQNHLASLGYVKARMGLGKEDILVILEGRAAQLAEDVFSLAGFEVVKTDRAVDANLLDVEVKHFFHLLPYVRHLDIQNWIPGLPRKVFIPRRWSRRLTNEADIATCLKGYGYEQVYFEDISIIEQWSLMRNATNIAAIHGAALGCLAFQATRGEGRRTRLVELFGPGFVVNPFRKYMAVLGGRWVGCRGRITPEVVRDIDQPGKAKAHAFDRFDLAVETLEAALNYIGETL